MVAGGRRRKHRKARRSDEQFAFVRCWGPTNPSPWAANDSYWTVDQLVYIARRAESVSLWPAPSSTAVAEQHEAGLVHLARNSFFSAYFF
jgi:hypothetical protein